MTSDQAVKRIDHMRLNKGDMLFLQVADDEVAQDLANRLTGAIPEGVRVYILPGSFDMELVRNI